VALPESANFMGVHAGKLLMRPDLDWVTASGLLVPRGSLVGIDLNAMMQDAKIAGVEIFYLPSGDDAIRSTHSGHGRLFVELLHDYASRLVELTPRQQGGWAARTIPTPKGRYIQIMDFSQGRLLLHEQAQLEPERIVQVDAQDGREQPPIYQQPAYFDASN